MEYEKTRMSAKRLNKMFKYFKGHKVKLIYNYANSLQMDYTRTEYMTYDRFTVEHFPNCMCFTVKLYNGDERTGEYDFCAHGEFTGVGKIREVNNGPYCYFTIKKTGILNKLFGSRV